MDTASLDKLIRTSRVVVHPGRYAYLQGKGRSLKNHFMIAQDEDETTVITREEHVPRTPHQKVEKWFALLEVRVSAPFIAKGFLAKITKTIADEGLNVLVVSTFSKDYILVREEATEQAVAALRSAGFPIAGKAAAPKKTRRR
ncbi:MAG: ACT domain-containing protein [Candidatus Aenigmarchaeota archaeon]|nr:ACT domain-containing protein [Candidatus Aenigmarchaeota archaeon]